MNKIPVLTKAFLKNSYQSNLNSSEKTAKKRLSKLLVYVLLFAYIAVMFGVLSYNIIEMLIEVNQQELFLSIFLFAVIFLVLIQTIFSSINVFYFAKDIEHILPLPVKPMELLAAKFDTLLFSEYIVTFAFAIAPITLYGILTEAHFMFYIVALVMLLLLPILPALIASFVIMIVMTFTKFIKDKDKFQMYTTIIVLILTIVLQMFITSNSEMTDEMMVETVTQINTMVSGMEGYFITLKPAVEALSNPNSILVLINTIKISVISLFAYLIYLLFGRKLYLKGAIAGTASGKKQKKLNENKAYKIDKVSNTYIKKEIKTLFRNPIYFVQCVLPVILMPILILAVLFISFTQSAEPIDINELLKEETTTSTICIIIAVMQFMMMMSYISITAISRDGGSAYFVKYIPVSLYKQFLYKLAPGIIFNIIPILIISVVFLILQPLSWMYTIPIFIIAMLINIFQNYIYLIIDLKRPKLHWNTEYAVVKQNMNMLYEFVISFVIMGLLITGGLAISNFNPWLSILIILAIVGLGTFIIDRYVYKNQDKLFEKIS